MDIHPIVLIVRALHFQCRLGDLRTQRLCYVITTNDVICIGRPGGRWVLMAVGNTVPDGQTERHREGLQL